MKFYNDFNAMFNAQSGLKKDMSVFNYDKEIVHQPYRRHDRIKYILMDRTNHPICHLSVNWYRDEDHPSCEIEWFSDSSNDGGARLEWIIRKYNEAYGLSYPDFRYVIINDNTSVDSRIAALWHSLVDEGLEDNEEDCALSNTFTKELSKITDEYAAGLEKEIKDKIDFSVTIDRSTPNFTVG